MIWRLVACAMSHVGRVARMFVGLPWIGVARAALILAPLALIGGGVAYYSKPLACIVVGVIVWIDLNRKSEPKP